jgi:2-phosphosulfolactate phosphatase
MRIELFPTPAEAAESRVRDREAVVVDVLRASTSIATSWRNGADRIIPLASVEEAKALHSTFPRGQALLCGERDGLRIDGFDLGNSPAEFGEDVVRGKALVFASSNGTRLMARQDGAREKAVASFVNLSASADFLCRSGADIAILCAGMLGGLSLEDFVCGGAIVDEVLARLGEGVETNDAAVAARSLWDGAYRGRILQLFRDASHGRYLVSLGFERDLDLCADLDSVPLVPVVREGRIARTGRGEAPR